ncbi:MAG: hypothetical protein M3Y87_30590 [Myxococcota bacterium]|nr:hypothetical protein [Myxococcota bacterium]
MVISAATRTPATSDALARDPDTASALRMIASQRVDHTESARPPALA